LSGRSSTYMDKNSKVRELHIECMVEALTDKYTMRSKAHKRLTKFMLTKFVIEESMK
jgi:hypothetical protein